LPAKLFVAVMYTMSLTLMFSPISIYRLLSRMYFLVAEQCLSEEYNRGIKDEICRLEVNPHTFAKTRAMYRFAGLAMFGVAVFATVQFVLK